LRFVWPNLQRYSAWLVQTHTPLIGLALFAPFVLNTRPTRVEDGVDRVLVRRFSWFALAFSGAVLVAYLVYAPFEDWTFLRFLLPGLPLLFVLVGLTFGRLVHWLPEPSRAPVLFLSVGAIVCVYLTIGNERGVFGFRDHERRYRAVGEYLSAQLPDEAIIVTVQHSGSARYYTGRPVLCWDAIESARLDETLTWVRQQGHRPFIVLERWEEQAFRQRFAAGSRIGGLDWPPLAQHRAGVVVYDPDQRALFAAGRPVETDRIVDGRERSKRSLRR